MAINLKKIIEFWQSIWKQEKEFKVKEGLFDEKDERNFGSLAIFTPTIKDVPNKSFIVYDPILKDQFDTDFCVGEGISYLREATEKIQVAGEFIFALCKKIAGTIIGFGTSILRGCKVAVSNGAPKWELFKLTGNNKRDYFANWNNIPKEAFDDAKNHLAQSYFEVQKGNLSWFDSFIANLWHFVNDKLLINTGVDGHDTTLIGFLRAGDNFRDLDVRDKFVLSFSDDRIVAKDSYDKPDINYRIGEYHRGYRFFSRNEASQLFTAYMITDMPRNLAEMLNTYNLKAIKGSNNKCYLVKGGKKCWISDEATAVSYNISPWDDVVKITDEELDLIPLGENLDIKLGQCYKILNFIVNSPQLFKK